MIPKLEKALEERERERSRAGGGARVYVCLVSNYLSMKAKYYFFSKFESTSVNLN
jgi:hypothetical protein